MYMSVILKAATGFEEFPFFALLICFVVRPGSVLIGT